MSQAQVHALIIDDSRAMRAISSGATQVIE